MDVDQQPTLGLTLAYFHHFIDVNGGRECFEDLSTLDVCLRFVKPTTSPSQLSLVDHVRSQPRGDEYAKPAQWLVSHSWSYKFLDVVDAIDNFCHEQDLSHDTSFWFCMFANNQHTIGNPSDMFDHWMRAFRTALEATGKMVMVLSPWHDPETLKRTWCVYEVYLSIVLNARFEIAMGKTQKAAFLQDIQGPDNIERMRAQVNCKNSITTVPTDRDHIFQLIQDNVGGTAALDRIVFDVILKWVLQTVESELRLAITPEDRCRWLIIKGSSLTHAGLRVEAVAALEAAVDLFRTELPPSFWRGWEAMTFLAGVQATMARPCKSWEPLVDEALPMLQDLLGPTHPVTLTAMRTAGASFCKVGRYGRARALLEVCLEHEQQTTSQDRVEKFSVMHNLGDVCLRQESLADAQRWYRQAIKGYSRLLGPSHDRCMSCQGNLATCYTKQGRYLDAEEAMCVVADETSRTLGPLHSESLRRRGNLAAIKVMRGQFIEADDMLVECIDNLRLINDAYGVAIYTRHRGLVKWCQQDYTPAKALLETSTASGVAIYGATTFLGRVGLLNSYMIRLEMGHEFDSIEKIDDFVAQLEAAELCHETWNEVLCHGCYKLVQGDLTMCSKCPRTAVRFCPTCVKTKPNTVCDHIDGPWIVVKPPMRYLLEQKLTLLATQKPIGWQVLYDATAAAYSGHCDLFNAMDRLKVRPSRGRYSHASVEWALAVLAFATTRLKACLKV